MRAIVAASSCSSHMVWGGSARSLLCSSSSALISTLTARALSCDGGGRQGAMSSSKVDLLAALLCLLALNLTCNRGCVPGCKIHTACKRTEGPNHNPLRHAQLEQAGRRHSMPWRTKGTAAYLALKVDVTPLHCPLLHFRGQPRASAAGCAGKDGAIGRRSRSMTLIGSAQARGNECEHWV